MKFIRGVKEEMKKVTWPTGKQLRRDAMIVIQTSIIFAILFYVMDTGVQTVFSWILKQKSKAIASKNVIQVL